MESTQLKQIIEAAIMVAGEPITVDRMRKLFAEDERPSAKDVQAVLDEMQEEYADKPFYLKKVASGYCYQAQQELSPWIARLWDEKAPKYTRASLETIAIIAYKQPVTRAEIESIRGVAVSSHIVKSMLDRGWIKIIGHKDVPGKPAIFGTTKDFLDYFNLAELGELPTLEEIKNLDAMADTLQEQLDLETTEGLQNALEKAELLASEEHQAAMAAGDEEDADDVEMNDNEMTSDDDIAEMQVTLEAKADSEDDTDSEDESELHTHEFEVEAD